MDLLDQYEFQNFRKSKQTKAALLADQNFLTGDIESRSNKVKSLSLINLYHKLSEIIDVNKINLEQLSVMALEDPSTSTNPRTMSKDDMKALYEHSISGKLF